MRLLLLTASFDPVIGGAESYALNVADGMAGLGHEVLVVTDTPHELPDGYREPVERAFELRRLVGYRQRLFDRQKLPWEEMAFSLSTELKAAVDDFRPEVLLSNSLDTAIQAAIIRRAERLPWAAAFHEHAPEDEPFGAGRMATVYGDLRPDAVLAGSEFYASRARRWGPAETVHLIHHGVPVVPPDPARAALWRQRYGVSDDQLLIVCVGRLKQRKGIAELLRAFGELQPHDPGLRLVVAGTVSSASIDYYQNLVRLRAELGCEDLVTFDETVSADEVPWLMSASDVVAQPSYEEGLGLAVLEGMAARRPVVTTRVVGINEIITEQGLALQVEAGDVAGLAGAIGRLVQDAPLRRRLGDNGFRHVVEKFSLASMVARTATVLGALVSADGTAGDRDPRSPAERVRPAR